MTYADKAAKSAPDVASKADGEHRQGAMAYLAGAVMFMCQAEMVDPPEAPSGS
ncbi:hypothetical protein H7H82_11760 [Mycobacterium heidelbergense]|uniref:hypothetical protein n=1 Tax=Mycobacterium heidelbergense TaxID=53376 RepID=UPI001301EA02|nr:hypothetical protein [Mycobacterium heidelbergense]MCV7051262.1 hypothetical protein [Mycobacterium heidelbergense]BBZ52005.1 hypothetical protein MHEI_37220 [Mycobacterium heidelbergense]